MITVLDNAHCMKHARSYPMDKECPQCQHERIVTMLVRESDPKHICSVCTPELWKEVEKYESVQTS